MVPDRRPTVLLIGARDFHEFDAAVQWLRAHTQLDTVPTVAAAIELAERQQACWHTVVIGLSRPGEFSQRAIDQLSRALPLSRLIALLGSCCEGELRSGRPWPGVVRVYWHQFAARAASELRVDGAATSWQMPRTVSDAERADHLLRSPPRAGGLIAICTRQAVFFDALAGACRIAGYTTAWMSPEAWWSARNAVAVLWHGHLRAADQWQAVQQVVAHSRPARVVVLLGFPRYDDAQRAVAAGVAAVLPIPLLLPDLWNTLREVAT